MTDADANGSYICAARLCLMINDNKMALFWAVKLMLVELWHCGDDSPQYVENCAVVRHLR